MKTAIISPHTDDAIFSLGSTILSGKLGHVTVISPFAGIPADDAGKKKHTLLRHEHEAACKIVGAEYINGDFFDDVYPDRELNDLEGWLRKVTKGFDQILIPLGIHHPDHVLIRNIYVTGGLNFAGYYEELPYQVLYPEIRQHLIRTYANWSHPARVPHHAGKVKAVEAYASQIIGGHILPQLYVEERVWL